MGDITKNDTTPTDYVRMWDDELFTLGINSKDPLTAELAVRLDAVHRQLLNAYRKSKNRKHELHKAHMALEKYRKGFEDGFIAHNVVVERSAPSLGWFTWLFGGK